jgi:hypothetical protein
MREDLLAELDCETFESATRSLASLTSIDDLRSHFTHSNRWRGATASGVTTTLLCPVA